MHDQAFWHIGVSRMKVMTQTGMAWHDGQLGFAWQTLMHTLLATCTFTPCHAMPLHAMQRMAAAHCSVRCSERGLATAVPCRAMPCHVMPCHAVPLLHLQVVAARTLMSEDLVVPLLPHTLLEPCHAMPSLHLQVVAARTLMSEDLATWRCQGAPRAEEIIWKNLGFRVWERSGERRVESGTPFRLGWCGWEQALVHSGQALLWRNLGLRVCKRTGEVCDTALGWLPRPHGPPSPLYPQRLTATAPALLPPPSQAAPWPCGPPSGPWLPSS